MSSKKFCCCEQKCGHKLSDNTIKVGYVSDTTTTVDYSFQKAKKSPKKKPKKRSKK